MRFTPELMLLIEQQIPTDIFKFISLLFFVTNLNHRNKKNCKKSHYLLAIPTVWDGITQCFPNAGPHRTTLKKWCFIFKFLFSHVNKILNKYFKGLWELILPLLTSILTKILWKGREEFQYLVEIKLALNKTFKNFL